MSRGRPRTHDKDTPGGTVFGNRTTVGEVFYVPRTTSSRQDACVEVECSCGTREVITVVHLRKAHGCRKCAARQRVTHGQSSTVNRNYLYYTWMNVRRRSLNRDGDNPTYQHVDIDPRWDESFEVFAEEVGERPSSRHSLDRRDNTKGYWPSNVRWATQTEQMRNCSTTTMLAYEGVTKALGDWADEYGLSISTLYYRAVIAEWPIEKALTKPVRKTGR